MKRRLFAAGAALALLSSQALAQSVAVELNPAQRTKIKEFVIEKKVPAASVKERLLFGSTLPADVDLRAVPADWGPTVSRYRYVYADNRIYFVEPSTRRIVRIVE